MWLKWHHLRKKLHGAHPLPEGHRGYTRPMGTMLWRCCKCGRFRLYGQTVEMYGEGVWWHECLTCCLDTVEEANRGQSS